MKKASEILGLPILNMEKGTVIGHVRELVVDPVPVRVLAFLLNEIPVPGASSPQTGEQNIMPEPALMVLPTANISIIGAHAVMVPNERALAPLKELSRLIEVLEARIFIRDNTIY